MTGEQWTDKPSLKSCKTAGIWPTVVQAGGLAPPRVAYKRTESYEIEESTVEAMEAEGILEFNLPYTTLWARLVKPTSQEN